MNRVDFEAAQAQVGARAPVREASYSDRSFGSWYVTVDSRPPRRIVWDGKECWLLVEQETADLFNGLRLWKEFGSSTMHRAPMFLRPWNVSLRSVGVWHNKAVKTAAYGVRSMRSQALYRRLPLRWASLQALRAPSLPA